MHNVKFSHTITLTSFSRAESAKDERLRNKKKVVFKTFAINDNVYGVDHTVEMKLRISVAIGGGAGKGMMRSILTDSLLISSLHFDFLYTRIKMLSTKLDSDY